MDERTPRSDAEAAPEYLRTVPPLVVERQRTGSARLVIGLVMVIAALSGGYIVFRSLHSTHPVGAAGHNAQAAPQPVGAATIGQGDIRVIINALGTVTPIATITVQTQINGQLQVVAFTEGQMVKKGDFLAQIDPRPYQLLQAQYEGQLARDQGVLEQDEGTVKLDQALIDQQKLNLAYCHIVSPVTGRIGLRLVDSGNYVQTTNSTGLA